MHVFVCNAIMSKNNEKEYEAFCSNECYKVTSIYKKI